MAGNAHDITLAQEPQMPYAGIKAWICIHAVIKKMAMIVFNNSFPYTRLAISPFSQQSIIVHIDMRTSMLFG